MGAAWGGVGSPEFSWSLRQGLCRALWCQAAELHRLGLDLEAGVGGVGGERGGEKGGAAGMTLVTRGGVSRLLLL